MLHREHKSFSSLLLQHLSLTANTLLRSLHIGRIAHFAKETHCWLPSQKQAEFSDKEHTFVLTNRKRWSQHPSPFISHFPPLQWHHLSSTLIPSCIPRTTADCAEGHLKLQHNPSRKIQIKIVICTFKYLDCMLLY